MTRARLADLARSRLVAPEGLIAHGRGEAFDYFLGERTTPSAARAIRAAARWLAAARHPVLSVNGNVAALAAPQVADVARALPTLAVEVNLFHRTPARARAVAHALEKAGVPRVLGIRPTARLPGLPSDRSAIDAHGIARADVVVVPLEDGDRAEALRRAGKRVISIDLNPLSRTSRSADLPIVDEVVRALDRLAHELRSSRGRRPPTGRFPPFDRAGALAAAAGVMERRLRRSARRGAARASSRPARGTPRRSRRTP